jgi:glycosyltransferase involved in cell wall biosynthesis
VSAGAVPEHGTAVHVAGAARGAGVADARAPRRRVAYVVKMFPRFSETFILNELLELERRGFEITVYGLKRPVAGPVHPRLAALRARVVVLPERPIHWLTIGVAHALGWLLRSPRRTAPVLLYVATRGTHQAWKRFFQAAVLASDLVHHPVPRLHAHFASAPARVAMLAARLTGRPFSFTAHAKDIYQHGTDADLLRDKIRAAAFVVTVSDYNQAYLHGLMGERNGHAIRRLYNGVDLSQFAPATQGASAPVVLAVGRLVEKKGFDDLLQAWPVVRQRHPRAQLVVVGEGPESGRLRDQAQALGLGTSVAFRGAEPQERVREALRGAAVFCLPCRVAQDGNRDGLPTVLLEALACGVPCVTTPVTGNPEIVRDGLEGRLVPPGDVPALARALTALLDDPAARAAMGRAGRARAEVLFDVRRNVGELASWFAEAP